MKTNPIYKRETTIEARSYQLAAILAVFNGILAMVALLNMYSVTAKVRMTAEIQYSSFLELYSFVAAIEFIMLIFIMPALTSGSISGERERKTLDLLMTTNLTPAELVIGKLAASFSVMALLIISSLPVLALVFVYGGITIWDLIQLFLCYMIMALYAGGIGIFFSSLFKRTLFSTVLSYAAIAVITLGTYAVNSIAVTLQRMDSSSFAGIASNSAAQFSSGGFLYLLLFNPAITYYALISHQVGNNQTISYLMQTFGMNHPSWILKNWVPVSIFVQLISGVLLVFFAIRHLDSGKR